MLLGAVLWATETREAGEKTACRATSPGGNGSLTTGTGVDITSIQRERSRVRIRWDRSWWRQHHS